MKYNNWINSTSKKIWMKHLTKVFHNQKRINLLRESQSSMTKTQNLIIVKILKLPKMMTIAILMKKATMRTLMKNQLKKILANLLNMMMKRMMIAFLRWTVTLQMMRIYYAKRIVIQLIWEYLMMMLLLNSSKKAKSLSQLISWFKWSTVRGKPCTTMFRIRKELLTAIRIFNSSNKCLVLWSTFIRMGLFIAT